MKKTAALLVLLFYLIVAAPAASDIAALRQKLALASGVKWETAATELATALTAKGDEEQKRQEYKNSLASYLEALALQKKIPAKPPSPHLLNNIGLGNLILGDYNKALDFLLQALAAAEKTDDREYQASSSYLIGYVHRDLHNFDLALQYFNIAQNSALAENNQRMVIMSLNEIGNVHVYREQYAMALPFKERSLKLAREHNDPELLANSLHDMGNMYLAQDQAAKALPFLHEALAIDRKLGFVRGIIIALLNIGDCQRRLGRFHAGLASLDEARSLAEKSDQAQNISEIMAMYSYMYEGMGDFRQALAFQRRYQQHRERLFNEEKAKQTAEMQTRFEVEKKQRENERLKQEKLIDALALDKQRSQRNFLFYLALLVMLLAAVIYSRFRIKARANRKLEAANSQIVSQQSRLEEAYHKMEDLARRDQLTGLPNRRAAMEELEHEVKRFQRSLKPFSLVMTDLDGFKTINDTLGHDAGDYVLQAAAGLFSGSLRAQDTVARWGGDEFLFLLPETDAEGARVICDAIHEKIDSNDFSFKGQRLKVAVSMGTGTFRAGSSIEECLREADQDMYLSRRK